MDSKEILNKIQLSNLYLDNLLEIKIILHKTILKSIIMNFFKISVSDYLGERYSDAELKEMIEHAGKTVKG